jgi:hypothetical protein
MIDDKLKDAIISEYLNSTQGRSGLSRTLVNPIRRRLDYSSVMRKAFISEPVFKFNCKECGMGWNDDHYAHSMEDCATYLVHES